MTLSSHILSEMPLVVFTILAQAVIGLSFIYAPAYINSVKLDAQKSNHNLKQFGLFFMIAMCIAFVPAFAHLNDISHIFNMINRVGVFYANNEWHIGWMNNEVLFIGICCALGILLYFKTHKMILFALVASGVLALFFMSGAYGSMQSSVPTWSFKITLLYFFASALFLGAILFYVLFAKDEHSKKMSFLTGLVGSGLLLSSIVLQTLHVGQTYIMGLVSPFDLLGGAYLGMIILSTGLIGLCMVSWYLYNYLNDKFSHAFISYFSLACAFFGVFITRVLFYGLISTQIMLGHP